MQLPHFVIVAGTVTEADEFDATDPTEGLVVVWAAGEVVLDDATMIGEVDRVGARVGIEEDVTVGTPPVDEELLVDEGPAGGDEGGTEVDVGAKGIELGVELGVGLGVTLGVTEYAVVDGSTGVDVLDVEETTTGGVLCATFITDESGTFTTGVSLGWGWGVVGDALSGAGAAPYTGTLSSHGAGQTAVTRAQWV